MKSTVLEDKDVCLVYLEKAFGGLPMKMGWTVRKKDISKVFVGPI